MRFPWQRWLWVTVLGIGLFSITYFYRGVNNYFGLSDAALLPGAILLATAGLRSIYRTGVYDVTGYSLNKVVQSFKRDDNPNLRNVHAYQEAKNMKRKQSPFNALPYLVIGGLFILLSYVFSMLAQNL